MLVTEREKRHGALGPRRLLPDGSDDGTLTSCGVVRPVPFIQTVLFASNHVPPLPKERADCDPLSMVPSFTACLLFVRGWQPVTQISDQVANPGPVIAAEPCELFCYIQVDVGRSIRRAAK